MKQTALVLDGIEKRYGETIVLRRVSFGIETGEIVGLLGPNGAGKTTLLKTIAGLSRPTAGRLEIFSENALGGRKGLNARIGLVPQENNMEREFTVGEALLTYAKLFGLRRARARVADAIGALGIEAWKDRKVDRLSGGMARRVLIARAMLAEPDLLLLDEPSVGLDPDMRQEIWRAVRGLKSAGKTVVITTHYMEEAEALCDRVAILRQGELLFMDTAEALKEKAGGADTLEAAFLRLTGRKEGA